jgi:hypothetical protein
MAVAFVSIINPWQMGLSHSVAFNYPAWSLDDVLLIFIVNPHGRKNLLGATITEGLSIFGHLPERVSF